MPPCASTGRNQRDASSTRLTLNQFRHIVVCLQEKHLPLSINRPVTKSLALIIWLLSFGWNHQHFQMLSKLFSFLKIFEYSRIPLSRALLTRGNQLVALAPWTPNFSDSSLAVAHMTEPVTHMCWSEQISPLVHSSQATWQPFNLSHCIEMHNTHLLGHVG